MEINNYIELLALHKIVMEAKFHDQPDDHDIAASPYVAKIARETVEALILAEKERGAADKAKRWERWKQVDTKSRFWKNSVNFVRQHKPWKTSSLSERRQLVDILLAPFEVTEEAYLEFEREITDCE